MHVVEWLRLRSTPEQGPALRATLNRLLETLGPAHGLVDVTTYVNATIPGDITLLLRWEGPPVAEGSALAARLEHLMKPHGLVDHSVWVPQRRADPRTGRTRDEETT